MNGGQPPPGALGLGEASAPNPTPPPVAAPPARDRGRRRRIAVVAAIVAIVVVAGGLGGYFVLTHRAASGTRVVDDGTTYYHALAQVNGTVQNVTGYPWALFSVFGVAAQAPFSANVLSYIFENYTVNTCGRLFNGPTLWNGTMPVFTGTFDSGTAPFWQFAFYSNTTHEDLIATDVLGTPYVYPPEQNQQPGTCYPWNAVPGPLAWSKALSLVSVNSPTAGAAAWGAVSSYWPQADEPWVQIITL